MEAGETNLGPLTTTFTPPAECNLITVNKVSFLQGGQTTYNLNVVQYYLYLTREAVSAQQCFPPRYTVNYVVEIPHLTAYYSPGTCPYSWGSYRTSIVTIGETAVMCCPSGFTPWGGDNYINHCARTVSTATVATVVAITGMETLNVATSTSVLISSGQVILANPVHIRYQASDGTSPLTATSTTPLTPSTSDHYSLATKTSTTSSTSSSGESGLSIDNRIALGVGIGFGLPALIVGIAGLYLMRRPRLLD
jgi:hypothetical protein